MYDANKVIAGIIVFLVFVTSPFWLNIGNSGAMPQLELPQDKSLKCVEDAKHMRANHMQLLDEWRVENIRHGERVLELPDGKKFSKSLSTKDDSCLGCHKDKKKFCDRCHEYVGVNPYCFSCHVTPEGK